MEMAVGTFFVLALVSVFSLNKLFLSLSVEGAMVLNCTLENNILDCKSKNLATVPELLDQSLETIDFEENNIETINEMDFAGLSSLRILTLSSNRISHIDEGSFRDLKQLSTLQLQNNQLLSLRAGHFVGLGNLKALLIQENDELKIDPCMFSYLESLTTLDVRNTMVDLDTELVTFKTTCPSGSVSFPYLANLKSLSIGHQGTTSNASILQEFSSLKGIILTGFSKASFHNADISTLFRLNTVTLIAADVYPREFFKSTSLTILQITESTFKCLPKNAFYNLPALQQLVIIRNSLAFIDVKAFSGASSLTFINLAFNKLVSLPEGIFEDFRNLTYFPQMNLHSNSWHCDCTIKWMQTFGPFEDRLKEDKTSVCETPLIKKGMPIFTVNLECDSDSNKLTSIELENELCNAAGEEDFRITTEKDNGSNQPPSQNESLVVVVIAAVAVVVLICVIILLIIATVCVNKKSKNGPPMPPPCSRTTTPFTNDPGYTDPDSEEDDNYSYYEPPNGLPIGLDIAFKEQQGPLESGNYVDVGSRPNFVSSPGYVNNRHGRLGSQELREAIAQTHRRREMDSDRPFYANSAPRNPPHPKRPR